MTISKLKILFVCLFAVTFSDIDMLVADDQDRKSYSISRRFDKLVKKIEKAYSGKDLIEANALISKGLDRKKNPYEEYILWRWKTNIDLDNRDDVIGSLENALSASSKIAPDVLETELFFELSRAHFAKAEYKVAHDYFAKWGPRDKRVDVTHFAYISQLYYALGKNKLAAKYADSAIELYETKNLYQPQQVWYNIAIIANLRNADDDAANTYLNKALTLWPNSNQEFCNTIASAYRGVNDANSDDIKAYVANSLAGCKDLPIITSDISDVMINPVPLKLLSVNGPDRCYTTVRILPLYPKKALRKNIEGIVTIAFKVLPDGYVDKKSMRMKAEPEGYFERNAVSAASKFRFGSKEGKLKCSGFKMFDFIFEDKNVKVEENNG
jgi:TonB family protein